MRRIVVVGNSGSGKTTVGRAIASTLGLAHLEMDSVMHSGGWSAAEGGRFTETVDRFTSGHSWVVDGNYTSHGTREVVWPRADSFVWLDLPRRVVMARVIARTLRRMVTREELWGGLREPKSNLYRLDPYQNIIVWAWTRHRQVQEKYVSASSDGSWAHATIHRLRNQAEVDEFLENLEPSEV